MAKRKTVELYERYRNFAYERGLSDNAVSVQTGVSKQTISNWKHGRVNLSLRTQYKLSQFLGADMDFTTKIS